MSFFRSKTTKGPEDYKNLLRLEPPYSTSGDCGYRALILGLLYLAQNDEFKDVLETQVLRSLLENFKKNLNMSNADTLVEMFKTYNANNLYSELTGELRKVALESKWLDNRIFSALQSGVWVKAESSYSLLPAIKALEQKKDKAMMTIESSDVELIRQEAWAKVFKDLSPDEQKKLVQSVKKQMYSQNVWVDDFFLKELCGSLLGSDAMNIFFDYKFEKTRICIGPGSHDSHYYITLPEDKFSNLLLKGGKDKLCSLDTKITSDSKNDNVAEKLHQKIAEFKQCIEYFNKEFNRSFNDISPGKSSNDVTTILGGYMGDILDSPSHMQNFTKLCQLADDIIKLQSLVTSSNTTVTSPATGSSLR